MATAARIDLACPNPPSAFPDKCALPLASSWAGTANRNVEFAEATRQHKPALMANEGIEARVVSV